VKLNTTKGQLGNLSRSPALRHRKCSVETRSSLEYCKKFHKSGSGPIHDRRRLSARPTWHAEHLLSSRDGEESYVGPSGWTAASWSSRCPSLPLSPNYRIHPALCSLVITDDRTPNTSSLARPCQPTTEEPMISAANLPPIKLFVQIPREQVRGS